MTYEQLKKQHDDLLDALGDMIVQFQENEQYSDLPYPEAGLSGADCDECGGMGHTIGFEGPKRIKHPCETCGGDK